jgi:UDP-glucose 4-epimerase
MKRILLLGGTGFVGSRLCLRLVETGSRVVVWGHNFPPIRDPAVEYVTDSLDNTNILNSLLPDCSHVFHLASATTPGSSRLEPSVEVVHNMLPMARLLAAMQRFPDVHFIFVSSGGAIYGDQPKRMVHERDPLAPISYYGAGKVAAEAFLHAYHKQTGNGVTIFRPSNLYGPGQRPKAHFGIIPTLLECVKSGNTFQIWGDGEIIRDYLFIEDFVELCRRTIPWASDQRALSVFNVGAGKGHSVNQLCDCIRKITNQTLKTAYQPSRGIDVAQIVLDSSAARSTFDWTVSTDLEDGLKRTWNWFNR